MQEQNPLIDWNTLDLDEPDYSVYSLGQLLDVYRQVDRDRYPERFSRLEEELNRRPLDRPVDQELKTGSGGR